MAETTAIKLELQHISKSFPGVKALNDVSFQLRRGTTHVLCGENGAGKSTLMKIINGIYKEDEGDIFVDGQKVKIRDPLHARNMGIAMIYQELSFVPDLTLEENICLGHWPMKSRGVIDWKAVRKKTTELLEQEGLSYAPDTKLRSLNVSDIQMIEILKAVSFNADIIIMDEPTSAITSKEVERLFEKIEQLKQRGASIVYISHKMDEIFKIADDITILRDGNVIETHAASDIDEKTVIELMVGRKIENQYPKEEVEVTDEMLRVEGLTSEATFHDMDFYVKKGEIVGFAGLMGAGRTEVMRALFGLDRYDGGAIFVKGQEVKIRNVQDAVRSGIAMLSEDRRRYGIVPLLSVKENIALAALDKFIRKGRWYKKEEFDAVRSMCEKMRVKTPTLDTKVFSLSGGNQQKVILAKWMVREPDILILDEPTRGIDVGAKSEIYQLMMELVKQGKSIIMVSSELPELIGMCDRVYVMHEGYMTGMLEKDELSQEAVMQLAVKSVQ
ncbi:sugar ABC transporter ATP-binding protein [Christensenella tenuis]|uniref:Sugar ABC transporter ATP-binding protein n=1 Tax=Christensenella tenuis TaxID=2763033 RepID=A0ABR7EI55_9FIRM|nr:sugar ABC transporter ATP-binding protein [Christensenella tenuis]MBC5649056.1 sugar ABC transporter ATP-binding protein [Christensenella tenuis]